MPITNRKLAAAAIQTGFFIITFIKNSVKDKDELYDTIIHELNFMGVDLDLGELKQLNELPKEKVIYIIKKTKLKIYNSITKSCGSQIADWFQLSFEVCLSISLPISIPGAKPTEIFIGYENQLQELAIRVGYPKLEFLHIMENLNTSSPKEAIDMFINKSLEIVKSPYIFISHASEDYGVAEEFKSMFKKFDIKTFVANIDILAGTDWEKQLREEVYKADELLLILSPKSKNSKWVMIEVGAAWILGKPITPAVMYANLNSTPEPIKKFQAKPILTSSQREKVVEDIVKRVYKE